MDGGFYVTLFSTASQNLFSDNTHSAYTNNLARPINLDQPADKWEVSVCEIVYPPPLFATKEPLLKVMNALIYLDISPQFIGNRLVRCARTFMYPAKNGEHVFDNIYYMPVEKTSFQTITRSTDTRRQPGHIPSQHKSIEARPIFSTHSGVVTSV